MKIVEFHGGLGNQLFEYTYYKYLKKKFPNEIFYTFINKSRLSLHNGFELTNWFAADIPPQKPLVNLLATVLFNINRVLRKLHLPLIMCSDDMHMDDSKTLHEGWYLNKKYVEMVRVPKFKPNLDIGIQNAELLKDINDSNSVAIHIRRGDFMLAKNSNMGGLCTLEYYQRALIKIKENVPSPKFFFFSDDPEYVTENFEESNMVVVTWNQGERSFFDLYLMSHCKNMILCNSTFSCWAAYLNKNKGMIISPSVWRKKRNPDLNMENWHIMNNGSEI